MADVGAITVPVRLRIDDEAHTIRKRISRLERRINALENPKPQHICEPCRLQHVYWNTQPYRFGGGAGGSGSPWVGTIPVGETAGQTSNLPMTFNGQAPVKITFGPIGCG